LGGWKGDPTTRRAQQLRYPEGELWVGRAGKGGGGGVYIHIYIVHGTSKKKPKVARGNRSVRVHSLQGQAQVSEGVLPRGIRPRQQEGVAKRRGTGKALTGRGRTGALRWIERAGGHERSRTQARGRLEKI